MNHGAKQPHAFRYVDWQRDYRPMRRILVIVDPTRFEQPAVEKAARIAAGCGSSLELHLCDVDQPLPESWCGPARESEYRSMVRASHLDELEHLAGPLRARGLLVTTSAERSGPLERSVGEYVIRVAPDLVVKETFAHGRSGARSATIHTDWTLIRQTSAPLLLVRERPWGERPSMLGAVDPCHAAERPETLDEAIVDISVAVTAALHGSLQLAHVLENAPHLPGDAASTIANQSAHERARTRVGALVGRAGVPVRFATGAPLEELARMVGEVKPDVLVIGDSARPHFTHSPASGTAARLLNEVDCDLLVLKPPGFVSPLLTRR